MFYHRHICSDSQWGQEKYQRSRKWLNTWLPLSMSLFHLLRDRMSYGRNLGGAEIHLYCFLETNIISIKKVIRVQFNQWNVSKEMENKKEKNWLFSKSISVWKPISVLSIMTFSSLKLFWFLTSKMYSFLYSFFFFLFLAKFYIPSYCDFCVLMNFNTFSSKLWSSQLWLWLLRSAIIYVHVILCLVSWIKLLESGKFTLGRNNFFCTFVFLGVASYLNSTIIKGIHARQRRDTFPPSKRYAWCLNYWIKNYSFCLFVHLFRFSQLLIRNPRLNIRLKASPSSLSVLRLK